MNEQRILEIAAAHVEKDGYVVYHDFDELKPVDKIGAKYLFPIKALLKQRGYECHENKRKAGWGNCGYPGRWTHFHQATGGAAFPFLKSRQSQRGPLPLHGADEESPVAKESDKQLARDGGWKMKNDSEPITLRGLVIWNWERAGRPQWDPARTAQEMETADQALESRGRTPAASFRRHLKAGDWTFVLQATHGNAFPWLKSRQSQRGPLPLHGADDESPVAEESDKQLALTLTNEQREGAREILRYVADEVERIADGDPDLSFRLRRYVHARLQLKNRPSAKLRARLFDNQEGLCEFCRGAITQLTGTDIHRVGPGRYTEENSVLTHRACHQDHHLSEGSQPEENE